MTAKVVVVTNQKGGCGKTTVAVNLAGALGGRYSVLLVDGDIQGSASRWVAAGDEDKYFPGAIMGMASIGDKAHREIKKYFNNFEYIVIDCPPAIDNKFTSSVLLVADLVLVPIIPSPTDLWATIGIQKLISDVSVINEKLIARLVANMCQNNSTISKEALQLINEFEFPKTNTDLYNRTAYRQSAALGGTVLDLNNQKAKEEINQLMEEVLTILS